jgi:SAM-dependent methyltransferase
MSLPSNYKFILQQISNLCGSEGRILDYGCGKGTIIAEGLQRGFSMFGCEIFGSGSGVSIRDQLREKGLLGKSVLEIENGKIPFPDNYFDLVISNQVFEHVQDLDQVCAEISRVLKSSGKLLCLFPVQECYRDHAGTLFAHWFPKNSKAQFYSLLFYRSLGFGRLKKGRGSPREWAAFFVKWLSDNTFYRSVKDIERLFGKYFFVTQHIEEEYITFRLNERGFNRVPNLSKIRLGKYLLRQFCIRWGGVVLLAVKK